MRTIINTSLLFISTFVLTNLLYTQNTFANSQNEFVLENVKILVDETSSEGVTISINTGEANQKVTAIFVANPARLVFDIMNFRPQSAKNLNINSPLFKKIRVGLHKDKTRLVFDCTNDELKKIIDTREGNNYSFKIASSRSNQPTKKTETTTQDQTRNEEIANPTQYIKVLEPTVAPTTIPTKVPPVQATKEPIFETPTPVPTIKTVPTEAAKKIEVKKTETAVVNQDKTIKAEPTTSIPKDLAIEPISPEENETITDVERKLQAKIESGDPLDSKTKIPSEVSKAVAPNGTKGEVESIIKSIVFQTTAEQMQSSMVISTSNPVNYSIDHTSKTSYELKIPGAKLKGDHLKLPQFPPDSFKGFLYFQASEVEAGVHIKIEVEENVNLSPYFAMGKLWIKAD